MDEQELCAIASQLSCPQGELGIEVGYKMNELNRFLTNKTIESLSPKQGDYIAEIGPGNGALSGHLLKSLGANGRYLGIELSETMAQEADTVLSNNDCEVSVVYGDCLTVDVEGESLDGVMAVNVIYFIEDLIPVLKHLAKWIKPEGKIVFGLRSEKALESAPFTDYGFNIRSTDEIMKLMEEAGFASIESAVFDEGEVPFGDMMISVDSVIIAGYKPAKNWGQSTFIPNI